MAKLKKQLLRGRLNRQDIGSKAFSPEQIKQTGSKMEQKSNRKSTTKTNSARGTSAALRIDRTNSIPSLTPEEAKSKEEISVKAEFKGTVREYRDGDRHLIFGSNYRRKPLTDDEAEARLKPYIVYISEEEEEKDRYYATYSLEEAATALCIDVSTVSSLVNSGKLVGYKRKSGELRVPQAQIRNKTYAPALDKISKYFETPKLKWDYLVYEQNVYNECVRPIEIHFRGDIKFAIGLAAGYGVNFL